MAILKRIGGSVIAEGNSSTLELVEQNKYDLFGAYLRRADLRRADLRRADLRAADLRGADLCRADLRLADLCRADLRRAYLCDADLRGVYLRSADLRSADLCRADLRLADLWDCVGNSREIITTQTDRWTVTRTADVMQVGCESHLIEEWWAFSDEEISKMDRNAMEWWTRWKPILQVMTEKSPATETSHD